MTPHEWLSQVDFADALWWTSLEARETFDAKLFSPRELQIMDRLVNQLGTIAGADMRELSEAQQWPWRRIYLHGEGAGRRISFDLALEASPIIDAPTIDREEIRYRNELLEFFK